MNRINVRQIRSNIIVEVTYQVGYINDKMYLINIDPLVFLIS